MITSLRNEKVKQARALHRRKRRYQMRCFLVEGLRLLEEVVRAGVQPARVFYAPEAAEHPRGRALLEALQALGAELYPVSDAVLRAIAATETPQGIVAVVPFVELSPPEAPELILVVDGLQDPGNLGTLLRTAAAAGVGEVLLAPGTVDPYNPKVVRGAAGAHFRLPITPTRDWEAIAQRLAGRPVWLADVHGEHVYYDVNWTQPAALIVGSEARGASDAARQLATGRVVIPMEGEVESLNAAVAAAVILFEALRQRRQARGAA